MKASRVAVAAWLAAALAVPASLSAQQPTRPLVLSREEQQVVGALQNVVASPDRAAQDAALAAARSTARGADARYAVASLQYQIARARGDAPMQVQAIDEMAGSGVPDAAEMIPLLASQASRTFSAGDIRATDRMLTRMVELQPNNGTVLADAAQIKARLNERAAAVSLMQRAIAAQRAAGQMVPETWYQRAVALSFDGRMAPQTAAFGRELVAHYPSPINWRDVLLAYRQTAAPPAVAQGQGPAVQNFDPALDIDIKRLLRAAQGLSGERDYLEFATALLAARLPGEAKAVLDEGIARGMIVTSEPRVRDLVARAAAPAAAGRTALAGARTRALAGTSGQAARETGDAAYGYGQFAEAAELYQAALQKGGDDANLVNLRLGAALAMAGRRPEAETALRAVTGPRADMAGFWLAWLSRRPA